MKSKHQVFRLSSEIVREGPIPSESCNSCEILVRRQQIKHPNINILCIGVDSNTLDVWSQPKDVMQIPSALAKCDLGRDKQKILEASASNVAGRSFRVGRWCYVESYT